MAKSIITRFWKIFLVLMAFTILVPFISPFPRGSAHSVSQFTNWILIAFVTLSWGMSLWYLIRRPALKTVVIAWTLIGVYCALAYSSDLVAGEPARTLVLVSESLVLISAVALFVLQSRPARDE
jgi:hypothetical protein